MDADDVRVKVYVLSAGSHEDWTLLGIYSTRENANQAKTHYERPHKVEWMDGPHRREANPIQEIPLDRAWADGPQDWPEDKPHEPYLAAPSVTPGSSSGVADGAAFAEHYRKGQAKDHYDTADLVTAFEAGKACQRAAGGEAGTVACQVCGQQHPPRYLFDLKGNVPGGCKVTCPACCNTLGEAEIGRLRTALTRLLNYLRLRPDWDGMAEPVVAARATLGGGAGRGT